MLLREVQISGGKSFRFQTQIDITLESKDCLARILQSERRVPVGVAIEVQFSELAGDLHQLAQVIWLQLS